MFQSTSIRFPLINFRIFFRVPQFSVHRWSISHDWKWYEKRTKRNDWHYRHFLSDMSRSACWRSAACVSKLQRCDKREKHARIARSKQNNQYLSRWAFKANQLTLEIYLKTMIRHVYGNYSKITVIPARETGKMLSVDEIFAFYLLGENFTRSVFIWIWDSPFQ